MVIEVRHSRSKVIVQNRFLAKNCTRRSPGIVESRPTSRAMTMTSRKFKHDTGGGGRGQIGRARHSVSLRNGDSPSRTISGGARGEEKSGEEWRRVASY